MPKKPKQNGRPTGYKPDYCEKLIEHMTEGGTFKSFAALVDRDYDTILAWTKKYPEFLGAKKRGLSKSLDYYLRVGDAGMRGQIRNFNVVVWIFMMKNIHGWRDRLEMFEDEEIDDLEFVA